MTDEQKYLFDLNGFILLPGVLTADECKTLREFVLTLRNDPESLPEIDRHSLSGPGSMLLDHPGRDGRGPVPPAVADVGEDSGDLFVGLGEGDHARRIDINSKGVVLVIDGDVVPEATDLNPDQVFRRTHHPFRGSEGWSAVDRHALTTVSVTGKAGEVSLLPEFHLPGINGVPDGRPGFSIRFPVRRRFGLGTGFRRRSGCLIRIA